MESGWVPSLDRPGCLHISTSFPVLQGGWVALRCSKVLRLEGRHQGARSPSFLDDTAGTQALMWTWVTFPLCCVKCYANTALGWGWDGTRPRCCDVESLQDLRKLPGARST